MSGLRHEISPARLGEIKALHDTCAWDFMPSNHLFDQLNHPQCQDEGTTDGLCSRIKD
jgi:hypothetical protein